MQSQIVAEWVHLVIFCEFLLIDFFFHIENFIFTRSVLSKRIDLIFPHQSEN